jgi:hypothetical protein
MLTPEHQQKLLAADAAALAALRDAQAEAGETGWLNGSTVARTNAAAVETYRRAYESNHTVLVNLTNARDVATVDQVNRLLGAYGASQDAGDVIRAANATTDLGAAVVGTLKASATPSLWPAWAKGLVVVLVGILLLGMVVPVVLGASARRAVAL